MVQLIVFLILAAVCVGSAIGMLTSKNAVYAALFLVLNFVVIAVFYLMLGAPFIAMVQITVYAGAIMVLFMFVIMLVGAEMFQEAGGLNSWQRPVALLMGFGLMVVTVLMIATSASPAPPRDLGVSAMEFGSPAQIGEVLYTNYIFPFELISFLLLAAMVGAVILTKTERKKRRVLRSLRNKN